MSEFSLEALLDSRRGEDLDLWARTINPQFVRVLRTIGFDRTWARAEGAYLYDTDGTRFLDLLGGFGMYGVGRNNPVVRAALVEALELETPGMLAMGTTLLPGPARRGADRARRRPHRALPVHELGHRVGRGGDQARARRDRADARDLRRARLPRPHARLALGERQPGVHGALPAAPARVRAGSVRRPRGARGAAPPRGRGALPRGAAAGKGRPPAARRLPRGRAGAVPPLRDALLRRRGDDRLRADGPDVRLPALGDRAGPGDGRQVALRRLRPGRARCSCRAPCTRRSSTRCRTRCRTARRSRRTSSRWPQGSRHCTSCASSGSWRRARGSASGCSS